MFRETYPTKEGSYTWWGPKHKERLENRGTRLDYFLISKELFFYIQDIQHHEDVLGSDHCPIELKIHLNYAVGERFDRSMLRSMRPTIDQRHDLELMHIMPNS